MKRRLLIICNMFIILFMIFYILFFAFSQRDKSVRTDKHAFLNTVEVMKQVSSNYLYSSQNICNNWAKYIDSGSFTMEEAMAQVSRMNADDKNSIQLLSADTLTGLSSVAKTTDKKDFSVSYAVGYKTLSEELRSFAQQTDADSELHVTRNFTSPMSGDFVVAFVSPVSLADDAGQTYQGLLLYLNSLDRIQSNWVFPVGYKSAEISIVDEKGDYIICADSMKGANFYEFIRSYNDLSYPESDAIRDKVNENESGGFDYRDSIGRKTYYTYVHIQGGNWILIGAIPIADMNIAEFPLALVLVLFVCFLTLILVNGVSFMYLNRKLAASLKEATQASKAKSDFLSSMSHDIRTPMNAIVGMTAIARRSIEEPEQVKDCLNKIDLASRHLLTLINDILDISRVESGKLRLNPEKFPLPKAMQSLINMMYPDIREKHLVFSVYTENIFAEDLIADELRISQIWINILSNAIKYTEAGGKVSVLLREEAAENDKIRLIYQVTDTGIGMSQEFLKTIFDAFTRATDSRINEIQGTGLGMTITKRMTDLMGGNIEVKSELGKGSVFTVTLPLERAKDAETEVKLPPLSLLISDSDPEILREAAVTLREMGAAAETVCSYTDTVSMIREKQEKAQPFDTVIVNADLFDGADQTALRTLREAAGDKTKILLASYDYSSLSEEQIRAGIDGRIVMPYFRSVLDNALNSFDRKAEDAASEPVNKTYSGINILVAEDNDLNWEIINRLLSFYGISSSRAQNGQECVDILAEADKNQYLLILMDIQMPVMNGYEAAEKIRSMRDIGKASIPIIAMTADAFQEDVERCRKAGMNGHIAKPINIDTVLKAVDQYSI
ncbi:MAG: response regulator [Lachnospiraceae bacterium]|jgi:two-component system sensor histidine kinase/response regulator|nr:response regulator [Lachnospiraceae bacterium]